MERPSDACWGHWPFEKGLSVRTLSVKLTARDARGRLSAHPGAAMKQDLSNSIPSSSPPFNPELAFPYLTEEMVARLQGYGHQETFEAGAALWTRGEREVDMFVVLEGTVEVYRSEEHTSELQSL